jgi:transcriptional regulator with XRE-family HTH domain
MLSTFQTIAERLKHLRTEAGISQDDMASIMGISRMTYIATESGNRDPKRHELENIARNFEVSMLALNGISEEVRTMQRTQENDPNYRFKQALLYILSKCGQRPNIGKTILNKLLYFSDFNFYEKNGERSITGTQYVKLPF